MRVRIICGDARDVLRTLPDQSVHCVVTSPPYWGLRDYGIEPSVWGGDAGCEHRWGGLERSPAYHRGNKPGDYSTSSLSNPARQDSMPRLTHAGQFCAKCGAWRGCLGLEPTPDLYVAHLVEVFREVWRVLRDDGTLWLNLGDSYASGKGHCFNPGGGNRSFQDYLKRNSVLNCNRLNKSDLEAIGLKPKDLVGIPWRVAFALQADGWYLRSDIVWAKANPMPESVMDGPTKAHEYVFLLTKRERYYYDAEAIKEPAVAANEHDLTSPGYAAPGQTPQGGNRPRGGRNALRGQGAERTGNGPANRPGRDMRLVGWNPTRNRRSVWLVATVPFPEAHFATFPPALVEPCVKAGTSEHGVCPKCGAPWVRVQGEPELAKGRSSGNKQRQVGCEHIPGASHVGRSIPWSPTVRPTTGWRPSCDCGEEPVPAVVLDPFGGAGTTGLVAARLGRDAILIDAKAEYCEMAHRRIRSELGMLAEVAVASSERREA